MLLALAALTLILKGSMGAAPATFHVVAKVEPSAENRLLILELDGDNYFRSSEFDLRDVNQKTFDWWPRDIPCGHYEVRAVLIYWHKMEEKQVRESRPAQVIGAGCDAGPSER